MGNVAEGYRDAVANPERQVVELLDIRRAGIEGDVIFARADTGDAGGHDDVGRLQGLHDVVRRYAFRGESRRVEADDDLARLAAIRRANREAGDREQLQPQEIERVIEDVLLGNRLAGGGELDHRHARGIELDDVRRRHARRDDAQDGIVGGGDLGDGAADIGAGLEIDFDDAGRRNRLRFHMRDAVDGLGVRALAHQHDAALHILGRKSGIVPCHEHDGDIDDREDVDDHARDRETAHEQDQQRGDGCRVRTAQRQAHQPHHRRISPRQSILIRRNSSGWGRLGASGATARREAPACRVRLVLASYPRHG
jgi:hypothetical protein